MFFGGVQKVVKNREILDSAKINVLGPKTARWGGGLPREEVVAEQFVLSLESLSSLGFEGRNLGCPRNFAGMSRTPAGVQKVCAKNVRAHFSFPNLSGPESTCTPMKLCAPKLRDVCNLRWRFPLQTLGVKFAGPFLAGNCAEKPILWVPI